MRKLSELTLIELIALYEGNKSLKDNFARAQNYQSALECRNKEVLISARIEAFIGEVYFNS